MTVRAEDGGGAAHEDEDIEVLEIPLNHAMAMIGTGEILRWQDDHAVAMGDAEQGGAGHSLIVRISP